MYSNFNTDLLNVILSSELFGLPMTNERTIAQNLVRTNLQKHFCLSQSQDVIFILDDRFNVRECSQTALKLLSPSHSEVIDKPILDFIHPDDRLTVHHFLNSDDTQPKSLTNIRLPLEDEHFRWFDLCFDPNSGGLILNPQYPLSTPARTRRIQFPRSDRPSLME